MIMFLKETDDPSLPPYKGLSKSAQEIARRQGDIFGDALDHMITEVAEWGEEIKSGPYLVSYAIEHAEGLYIPDENGELVWEEPQAENIHLEISVRDAKDGRFIPALLIYARLTDNKGDNVGHFQLPFIWHPWVYHYSRNCQVERSGDYTLQVQIKAPNFARHDKKEGKRFGGDVEIIFSGVRIFI